MKIGITLISVKIKEEEFKPAINPQNWSSVRSKLIVINDAVTIVTIYWDFTDAIRNSQKSYVPYFTQSTKQFDCLWVMNHFHGDPQTSVASVQYSDDTRARSGWYPGDMTPILGQCDWFLLLHHCLRSRSPSNLVVVRCSTFQKLYTTVFISSYLQPIFQLHSKFDAQLNAAMHLYHDLGLKFVILQISESSVARGLSRDTWDMTHETDTVLGVWR